jgi:hypothetical protein
MSHCAGHWLEVRDWLGPSLSAKQRREVAVLTLIMTSSWESLSFLRTIEGMGKRLDIWRENDTVKGKDVYNSRRGTYDAFCV